MLDGRVKTLHPTIHGGLLARRDSVEHMAALDAHGIATIDLLVVNLYPFEATVAKADCTLADAIENIDIGGPAMGSVGGEELAARRGAHRRVAVRRRDRRAATIRAPSPKRRASPSPSSRSTASPSTTARSATTFRR